ncbi:MAG: beta-galactosidase [Lentisphaeria bacterium]
MRHPLRHLTLFLTAAMVTTGTLLPCQAGGAVANGSFEQAENGRPAAWSGGDNGARCTMSVVAETTNAGANALLIRNETTEPGKYGNLHQTVRLLPGCPYELTCWVRGANPEGKVMIAVGNGWKQRLLLTGVGPQWKKCVFPFTLSDNEVDLDGADLAILSEGVAQGLYLDEVTITTPQARIYAPDEFAKIGIWLPYMMTMHKEARKIEFACADPKGSDTLDFTLTTRDFSPATPLILDITGGGKTISHTLWTPGKKTVSAGAMLHVSSSLPLTGLPRDIPYQMALRSGGDAIPLLNTDKIENFDFCKARLTELEARRQAIERQAQSLPPEKTASGYLTLQRRVLADQLPPLLKYFYETPGQDESRRAFLVERARLMLPATREALDNFARDVQRLADGGRLPEAWRLSSEKVEIVNGWPWASITSDRGNQARRQVVFTGYGHFAGLNLQNDIPLFNDYGANIIQIEIGPRAILQQPAAGKPEFSNQNWATFDDQILRSLKLAHENKIKVCLLISPHYIPDWWKERHPDLVRNGRGFSEIEINHPVARELFAAHIDALVSKVKNGPYADAVHSFCITNEPQYAVSLEDAYTRERLQDYLIKKYGSLEKFNQTTQRRYADFNALFAASASDLAVKYELGRYRTETFTAFHRFLADRVRQNWPEIPCQAKLIPFHYFTDPGSNFEEIGAFSTYNGNDNATHIWDGKTDCHSLSYIHEMQLSTNPGKSIVNMENHIICDRDTGHIPNSHIYLAIFHPFFTGASAQITWVWADLNPDNRNCGLSTDFIGNIRLRPGNIIAQGKAHLDAMRLAPELAAFTAFRPKTAILASPTSAQLAPEIYKKYLTDTYYAGSYFATTGVGQRLGFLSERQLQRDDWGDCKALLVTGAAYLEPETYNKLAAFCRAGGVVYADATSLKNDPFGNPVKLDFPIKEFVAFNNKNVKEILDRHDPLPIAATCPDTNGMELVLFRAISQGQDYLIYLCNLNNAPRTVTLTSKPPLRYSELIQEQADWPATFELKQNEVILLRAVKK